VQKAIDFEIKRQAKILRDGGTVQQETRGWDADRGVTLPQRLKESAHDYRYFPEPDLVPVVVDEAWEQRIRASLPELPKVRLNRFKTAYGLSDYDANVLTADVATANYFEAAVKAGAAPKPASNWIQSELLGLLMDAQQMIDACK